MKNRKYCIKNCFDQVHVHYGCLFCSFCYAAYKGLKSFNSLSSLWTDDKQMNRSNYLNNLHAGNYSYKLH